MPNCSSSKSKTPQKFFFESSTFDFFSQIDFRIKATINPPTKTKSVPKIEAKVKNENGINTNGLKPVATVQIRKPEPNRLNQTDPLSGSTGTKLNSLRANSPMLQTDKGTI